MRTVFLVLGFAVGGILFCLRLEHALRDAPANAAWPTYRRVDWWILSARCTQMKKVLLVACGPHGELYPIEDISPTDDRGHGLLANLVALFQNRPFEKVDMVRINVCVNAAAVAVLALVLCLCGMPWGGFLCLLAGAWYGIPGPMASADAQATFFGEYCLILTPIPWIVQLGDPIAPRGRLVTMGAVSWMALIAAILLREAIGLVGIFSTFLFLGVTLLERKSSFRKACGLYGLMAGFLFVALTSNSIILTVRNRWLSLPPSRLISSHGIAHAFHQGLGTEDNPWGIRYDDRNGAETIQKMNPKIIYGTPEYYREMRRLYIDILIHHPLQVAAIYMKKLKKTLGLPLLYGGISIFWYVLAVTAALPFLWKAFPSPSIPLRTTLAMEIVLVVFLLQGVFIRPMAVYLYPAKFGMLMLLIGLVEAGMSSLSNGLSLPHRS